MSARLTLCLLVLVNRFLLSLARWVISGGLRNEGVVVTGMLLTIVSLEELDSSNEGGSLSSLCSSIGSQGFSLEIDSLESGEDFPASSDSLSSSFITTSEGTSIAELSIGSPGFSLFPWLGGFPFAATSFWRNKGWLMLEVVIGVVIEVVVVVKFEVELRGPVFPTDGSTFFEESSSDPV